MGRFLMVLVAGLALAMPVQADTYEGLVNSVQYNYFTVMQGQNKVARVLARPGTTLPSALRTGVKIRLEATTNANGDLVLDEIDELSATSLTPIPYQEPGINVPLTNGKVYVPIPLP